MRVEGGAARVGGTERDGARFREALARAEGPAGATRPAAVPRSTGGARAVDLRRPAVREPAGGRAEEGRGAPPVSLVPGRDVPADLAPVAEIAGLARVLPPAIAALGSSGASLSLTFGSALAVELRSTAEGVHLVLRAEPAVARAAEAELPRLVAALRVRGVVVAHAQVRARGQPGGRAR